MVERAVVVAAQIIERERRKKPILLESFGVGSTVILIENFVKDDGSTR